MNQSMNHRFRVQQVGEIRVLELQLPEDLEAAEFDALNDAIAVAITQAGPSRWVLDLVSAEYLGSALLGLLVNVRTKVRLSRGTLVLCGLSPTIDRVLRAASMAKLFVIVDDRAAAIRVA